MKEQLNANTFSSEKSSARMEDVIKRSGNTFGTNEAFILTQLSVAAVPTAAIIFLDIITNQMPQVKEPSAFSTFKGRGTTVNFVSLVLVHFCNSCTNSSLRTNRQKWGKFFNEF